MSGAPGAFVPPHAQFLRLRLRSDIQSSPRPTARIELTNGAENDVDKEPARFLLDRWSLWCTWASEGREGGLCNDGTVQTWMMQRRES